VIEEVSHDPNIILFIDEREFSIFLSLNRWGIKLHELKSYSKKRS
jgi:hypothetical protein